MALVPCRECGAQISSEAKACPRCGAKPRTLVSGIVSAVRVLGYIGFAIVLFVTFSVVFRVVSSYQ